MNARAAIISLIILLAVSGIGVFLLRPAPPAPATVPSWLARLSTTPVERLEFRVGDRVAVMVERRGAAWFVSTPDGSRPDWPADETRVRGLISLLAESASSPSAPAASPAEPSANSVTLRTASGESFVLAARQSPIGGRCTLLTNDDPPGTTTERAVDCAISQVLSPETVISFWPRHAAFPAAGIPPSRIRLETGGYLLELSKTRGRWNVLVPFATPADADASNSLAAILEQLGAARLIGAPDAMTRTWAASPTTFIEIESAPVGDDRRVLVQELRIGGTADPGTLLAQARAEWLDTAANTRSPAWGPMVLTVDRAATESLTPDLAAFASKRSVQTPAPDIGGLWLGPCGSPDALRQDRALNLPRKEVLSASEFGRVRFERTIDGWRKITIGTTGAVLSPAETSNLASLLKALCESPAAGITPDLPPGTACAGALVLTDSTGAPVAVVGIGSVPGVSPNLIVRAGRLYRVYGGKEIAPLAAWMNDLLAESETP
ncbi:MAG: hypothetical protein JNK25_00490 [Phycisphaerae bacterium]|nr:hypothetical protein [Phycisphaerae bacterium]